MDVHDPSKQDVLLLVNPKAGARKRPLLLEELSQRLAAEKLTVHVISDREELSQRAFSLTVAGRLRAVVAAGGDGTMSLAANLLDPAIPLVPLPLGTENLLAKYLGIQPLAHSVAEVVLRGRPLTIDAGLANGRLFLLMAGCGFDADVVQRLHNVRTGHIHRLSYFKPILDSIRNYDYPELRVRFAGPPTPAPDPKPNHSARPAEGQAAPSSSSPSTRPATTWSGNAAAGPKAGQESPPKPGHAAGREAGYKAGPAGATATDPEGNPVTETFDQEIRARWAFVVNLPRYAGGLSLVPDADGSDGLLDVCTFKNGSFWTGLWYFGGVVLGQHRQLNDCITGQAARVRIEADADHVPYQLDGDPGGYLPLDIRILPQRLTLLVPPDFSS